MPRKMLFNILTDTTPVWAWTFDAVVQRARAEGWQCERVFRFRYIAGDLNNLPKYMSRAFRQAGLRPYYLGGKTDDHSIIGLAKRNED